MAKIKKGKLIKKVQSILIGNQQARDDDRLLSYLIWKDECEGNCLFLEEYVYGRLTSANSITRARRLLQEKNPSLRGENWGKRHIFAEKVIDDVQGELFGK